MRSKWLLLCVLAALTAALSPPNAIAQYDVPHRVVAGGGGVSSGTHIVYCTVGQPVIGVMTGASNLTKGGFWYIAGVSSTVDVAIVAFSSTIVDDAVVLDWTPSAAMNFQGYNVYRSETNEQAFVKINSALIVKTTYRDETAEPGKVYLYRVGAQLGGEEIFSLTTQARVPPRPLTLYQNYPNPFNPSTSIAFYTPKQQRVSLVIYGVSGVRIRVLCDRVVPEGKHTLTWNGRNDNGASVGSGIYYYRLIAGKEAFTKKLVIVR